MEDITCEGVDYTAQVCEVWFGVKNMPHPVGRTPRFESHKAQSISQTTSGPIRFFRIIRIKCRSACLVIYFPTYQMRIEGNEKPIDGVPIKGILAKMGPYGEQDPSQKPIGWTIVYSNLGLSKT